MLRKVVKIGGRRLSYSKRKQLNALISAGLSLILWDAGSGLKIHRMAQLTSVLSGHGSGQVKPA